MFIKQLITIISFFLVFNLSSQNNTVVIFSNIGLTFNLSINQKTINAVPQSNVKAFDLSSGWQKVTISTFLNNKDVILNDSFFINYKYINKEFTFVLTEAANKLKFNSIEKPSGPNAPNIPEAPKEIIPLIDNSIYGKLYRAKNNKPVFFYNYNKETKTCQLSLTDKEIKYAIILLKKSNDDELKLRYLNTILESNCYSAIQLKELLTVLNLEMDILNSAKLGYLHVTDKENIMLLMPSFKYQSIKDSFSEFLKNEDANKKQKALDCSVAISDEKFSYVIEAVKLKAYENEKLISAKKQLVNNCISTVQTKQLLALFTHDREKIEILKSAYNVLVDKENVKNLELELQFQESKDEFLKYVNKL